MMKTRLLLAATCGALLVSTAASAQVQGNSQQDDILGQLLGTMFGNTPQASEQTLESDWNEGRRPFETRRSRFDARIDEALRDGSLSRAEADQVRREYNDIVRLEASYSADGDFSAQQRSDLRARYRALAQRVGGQGYAQGGNQGDGRWLPLSQRGGEFEQRVAAGLSNRTLTPSQATRLRHDWRSLAQAEANYRSRGIDQREQTDLWARYNAIDSRLDGSNGFGNDRNTARWSQMQTRLVAAERNGRINRNEAVQMRWQLNDLSRLDVAYASNGYSADQRSYLTQRYAELDGMLGYSQR